MADYSILKNRDFRLALYLPNISQEYNYEVVLYTREYSYPDDLGKSAIVFRSENGFQFNHKKMPAATSVILFDVKNEAGILQTGDLKVDIYVEGQYIEHPPLTFNLSITDNKATFTDGFDTYNTDLLTLSMEAAMNSISEAANEQLRDELEHLRTDVEGEIGSLADLTTTDKDNLVGAINEVNAKAGDITQLATTDKDNLVEAVNEVVGLLAGQSHYKGLLQYGAATVADMNAIPTAGLAVDDLCGVHATQLTYKWDGAQWVEQPHGDDNVGDTYEIARFYGDYQGITYSGDATASIICASINPSAFDLIVNSNLDLNAIAEQAEADIADEDGTDVLPPVGKRKFSELFQTFRNNLKQAFANIGNLNNLTTSVKTDLVGAINSIPAGTNPMIIYSEIKPANSQRVIRFAYDTPTDEKLPIMIMMSAMGIWVQGVSPFCQLANFSFYYQANGTKLNNRVYITNIGSTDYDFSSSSWGSDDRLCTFFNFFTSGTDISLTFMAFPVNGIYPVLVNPT